MTLLRDPTATYQMEPVTPTTWRRVGSAAGTSATVALAVIASLAIVLAVATRFSPRGQYRVFGHPVMVVLSGSMTPVIRTGDLVVDTPVTRLQAQHLRVGQIISVRDRPGSLTVVTHRIAAVTALHGRVAYVTKGDANGSPDSLVRPASDVVGVFSFAVPDGGYVLNALHKPLVLGLLLASAVLWLAAGPLWRLSRRDDDPAPGDAADLPQRATEVGP